ncbi:MAG: ABC transporter permease [Phycisphaerales bacterium]|nr:ABC transporter permease [Phycisphaerales bacterium]
MKVFLGRVIPPVLVVLAVLVAWSLVVRLSGIKAYLLPAPLDVVHAMIEEAPRLTEATLRTAFSTTIGFLIAATVGVLAGSLLGLSRWLERGLYPPTLLLQMVPLVAIAPLFVVWFGFGAGSTIAATVVVALFPVIASTLGGMRSTDPELRELFRLLGAGRAVTWWKLQLPSAIPSIVTGLRVAAGLSVIGAITAEFVSGYTGDEAPLGAIIMGSIKTFRTDLMFGAVLIASLVGFLLFGIVNTVGWMLLRRWHGSIRD